MSTPAPPRAPQPDGLDRILDRINGLDALATLMFACTAGYRSASGAYVPPIGNVLVEYCWARLLRRGSLGPPTEGEPVATSDLLGETVSALAYYRPLDELAPDGMLGIDSDPRRRLAEHGLWGYDPALPAEEIARWSTLFEPFADEVEQVAGLRPAELPTVVGAFHAFRHNWSTLYAANRQHVTSPEEAQTLRRRAVESGVGAWVTAGLGASATLTVEQLANDIGRAPEAVERFCELFATTAANIDATLPFDQLVWHLRRRPIARWDERILLPSPFALTMAIRPRIELALRTELPPAGRRYDAMKGRWLEKGVHALLRESLPADEVYRALRVPAAKGEDPERDGLMRVDTYGLAIEIKGGGVPPSARGGAPHAQDRVIERLVHEAVRQADSLIAAVEAQAAVTGVPVDGRERVRIDGSLIHHWIPLVVTLEDMSGVVGSTRATFGDRDPQRELPIVISLDDLRWYADELALPAQILHYFVVRSRIARLDGRIVVLDETEWFRTYVHRGAAHMQAVLGEILASGQQLLATGSLRRGELSTRWPIWRTPFERLLRDWQDEHVPGWLEGTFALLDLSQAQAAQLPEVAATAFSAADCDGSIGLYTVRPAADPSVALHVVGVHPDFAPAWKIDSIGDQARADAGDARVHVVTVTHDGTVDALAFKGVATLGERPDLLGRSSTRKLS
ncbi:MAG TPA: hypothetical protein VFG31_02445 [Conexibacter sp.]|nr:hypothetical protein [Conexibacter sp.]